MKELEERVSEAVMQELIDKVTEWAKARNLIEGSTQEAQGLKLLSEMGELADNFNKGRDCSDDIGDCLVVLIILCNQIFKDDPQTLNECFDKFKELSTRDQEPIGQDKGVFLIYASFLTASLCEMVVDRPEMNSKEKTTKLNIMVLAVGKIAHLCSLKVEKCLEHAYNDIKDRKGIMLNDVYIKDSDIKQGEK